MLVKRIIAHIINKVIIFFPAIIILTGIALVIAPNYFIFGKDDSAWNMVFLYKWLIFLPLVFYDFIREPSGILFILEVLLPTLTCMMFVEVISIVLMKRDIGMKIMGLKIISTKDKPLTVIQIIARTLMKYFSLAFVPFVLIYVFFNKERMTLHDKLSSTRVVRNTN